MLIYIGCFSIFLISSKANLKSRVMNYIGMNTLLIYAWHPYPVAAFKYTLILMGLSISNVWIRASFITLFSIAFCCVCSIFVNKYFPLIVGKKKKRI